MTNHFQEGFVSMQENSPCAEQNKRNAPTKVQSRDQSAVIWQFLIFLMYLHSQVDIVCRLRFWISSSWSDCKL